MKNKKHPDSSGNKSSKAMSYSCLTNFFHKTLSHFFKKFVFINLMLLTIACKKEKPTEYDTLAFDMQVEDVSCTEVWLKVKLGENLQPRNITLKRENTTIFTGEILNSDTTFIDENLLPKRSYKYTISKLNELGKEISRDVVATTMDTTSHDFTWQIDTLGDGYSVLSDVAIINDTLAYAVGEIYKRDSLGNWDPQAYNMVRWNGSTWQLMRIQFYTICGQSSRTPYPAKAIFAFSANDIWIAMDGDQVARWNGTTQTATMCLPVSFSINKLWGENPNSVYAVGWGGNIIHYSSGTWRRLESGTTLHLSDIFGVSKNEIYAVGINYGQLRGIVLKSDGKNWEKMIEGFPTFQVDSTELFKTKLYGVTEGVWMDEKKTLYTVGNLMYQYKKNKWDYVKTLPENYPYGNPYYIYRGYLYAIRGNASNDMFIFGEINTIRHFNGVSWSEVGLPYYPLKYDIFWYSCDVKGKLAIGVGKIGRRALAIIIKR